jgi:CelD/BcsL family acetyltransferase involved in cellulose biosynthesis
MTPQVTIIDLDGELSSTWMNLWQQSLRSCTHFRSALQTPEWVNFRWKSSASTCLAVLREGSNEQEAIALTPLVRAKYVLRRTRLGQIRWDGYLIVGSSPLYPPQSRNYEALLQGAFASLSTQCIYVTAIHMSDPFATFLLGNNHAPWFVFAPERHSTTYYWIEMTNTFEEYCRKFKHKHLYNLQRELRRFASYANNELNLVRVTDAKCVDAFVAMAGSVAKKSWQRQLAGFSIDSVPESKIRGGLRAFAKEGILRSYILKVDKKACAFAVGFQMNGVFHFLDTAYDPEFSQYSPGKCLLQLLIKDLFLWSKPKIVYFGPSSDHQYKQWFSTHSAQEIDLLILRNTVVNHAKVNLYRLYQNAVASIKRSKFFRSV